MKEGFPMTDYQIHNSRRKNYMVLHTDRIRYNKPIVKSKALLCLSYRAFHKVRFHRTRGYLAPAVLHYHN